MAEDKDKLIASYEARIKELEGDKKSLKTALETGDKVLPVKGTFTASVTKKGETVKTKFGFKDGYNFIRNSDSTILPTESVIEIANTGKIDDDAVESYPTLKSTTQESAQALLQSLVDLGFAGLKTI